MRLLLCLFVAIAQCAGCDVLRLVMDVDMGHYTRAQPSLDTFRTTLFPTPADDGRGRVFGVFVAVSHYHGRAADLRDAEPMMLDLADRLETALPEQARAVILTDDDASRRRLVSTVRALAIRLRPADTLVLAFYVHGTSEALMLDDDDLAGPQLARLIAAIPARVLLVLNSCGSGGLAPVVAGAPGRWGIFSSDGGALTIGAAMLATFGNALSRHVGLTPDGGLAVSAIVDYVRRSAADHSNALSAHSAVGFVPQHWSVSVDPTAREAELGGLVPPDAANRRDCRDRDGCVSVDEALDHVLDPLDDTARAAPPTP